MGPVEGRRVVVALALTAVVAAGCGSSSSSSELSKQQLASRANAICTSFKPKIAAVKTPSDVLTNPTSAARYFDQIAPLYDQAVAELKKLKPASSVQGQWNEMLARFGGVTSLIDRLKANADKGQRSGAGLLSQVVPRANAADAAAGKIGATACGSSGIAPGG